MQKIKKMVRKPSLPIQQVMKRVKEIEFLQEAKSELAYTEIFNIGSVYPNNYCIVNDNFFKIIQFDNDILKGHFVLNLKDFFTYPVPSSDFSIFSCNEEILCDYLKSFVISEIKTKVAKLQLQQICVYIPLQHL